MHCEHVVVYVHHLRFKLARLAMKRKFRVYPDNMQLNTFYSLNIPCGYVDRWRGNQYLCETESDRLHNNQYSGASRAYFHMRVCIIYTRRTNGVLPKYRTIFTICFSGNRKCLVLINNVFNDDGLCRWIKLVPSIQSYQ
jgi:hypothetical protein